MPFSAYEAHAFFAGVLLIVVAAFFAALVSPFVGSARADLVLISIFLFWVLAFASVVFSEIPFTSFIFFFLFSLLPLSFFLTVFLTDKAQFFLITGTGFALIFSCLSLFSFYEYFFLQAWLHKGLAHWPLSDPNSFAALYSLAFFCALGLMLGGKTRFQSNTGLALALLFISTIFLTGSKGVLASLVLWVIIFMALSGDRVRQHRRCLATLMAFSIVIFLTLGFFHTGDHVKIPIKSFSPRMDVIDTHAPVWTATWHIIRDHFWTGTGIGTFFLYYPAYRSEAYTAGYMAHSDPLQFWAEMGVFAPLLFYTIMFLMLVAAVKKIKALRHDPERRMHVIAPLCALGAMVLHGHINFNFNIPSTLIFSGLLLGYLYNEVRHDVFSIPLILPGGMVKNGFLLALMVGTPLFALIQTGEIMALHAKRDLARGDLAGFSAKANLAETISLHTNGRAKLLAAELMLTSLETQPHMPDMQKAAMTKQADSILNRARSLNPRDASILFRQARLYKISAPRPGSRDKNPEALLRQALALDPLHAASRLLLADILIREGKDTDALYVLKLGLQWPTAPQELVEKTAILSIKQGDMEAYKLAIDRLEFLKRHAEKAGAVVSRPFSSPLVDQRR